MPIISPATANPSKYPMVFLDTDYWTKEMPVYPMLEQLSATGRYKNLILSIGDEVEETVTNILAFTNA